MTQHDLDIYYEVYLQQRKTTMKYIKSRKGMISEFGKQPVSKSDFKLDIQSIRGDNPKKSFVAIAKQYAKDQLYDYSYKEALRRAEAHVREFGGAVNVNLAQQYRMQSRREIFDVIQARRTGLKAAGMNSYSINLMIGQEFFGS